MHYENTVKDVQIHIVREKCKEQTSLTTNPTGTTGLDCIASALEIFQVL